MSRCSRRNNLLEALNSIGWNEAMKKNQTQYLELWQHSRVSQTTQCWLNTEQPQRRKSWDGTDDFSNATQHRLKTKLRTSKKHVWGESFLWPIGIILCRLSNRDTYRQGQYPISSPHSQCKMLPCATAPTARISLCTTPYSLVKAPRWWCSHPPSQMTSLSCICPHPLQAHASPSTYQILQMEVHGILHGICGVWPHPNALLCRSGYFQSASQSCTACYPSTAELGLHEKRVICILWPPLSITGRHHLSLRSTANKCRFGHRSPLLICTDTPPLREKWDPMIRLGSHTNLEKFAAGSRDISGQSFNLSKWNCDKDVWVAFQHSAKLFESLWKTQTNRLNCCEHPDDPFESLRNLRHKCQHMDRIPWSEKLLCTREIVCAHIDHFFLCQKRVILAFW